MLAVEDDGVKIGEKLFKGKNVLEVGSGPGLGGFIASKWAKSVVLTDY